MKLEKLRSDLLVAAKSQRPSQEVPYGFERRIMARLKLPSAFDYWAFWARALWQAAAPCIALMVLLIAWVVFRPVPTPTANDLSLDLENTLLTVAEQEQAPPVDIFW